MSSINYDLSKIKAFVFDVDGVLSCDVIPLHPNGDPMRTVNIYMKSAVKVHDYRDFLEKTGLQPEEVMYAGDDIPDYEVMTMVGLPVAPADAAPEIKRIAKYISHKNGGAGVARDVIEQVMRAQGHWMGDEAFGW